MRRLTILAAGSLALALPALAQSMTIEFTPDNGEPPASWTFTSTDETSGIYTAPDGSTGPFTWDAETATLCGKVEGDDMCATFDEATEEPAVGDTSTYTTSDGETGVAEITAMTEASKD